MYYRERQVAHSLGCIYLGNRESRDTQKGGGGVHVSQSWDLYLGTRVYRRINVLGSAWDL